MLGAVMGDVLGSTWEFMRYKPDREEVTFFPPYSFFTDDTVMTLAVDNAVMAWYYELPSQERTENAFKSILVEELCRLGTLYPHAGYGRRFKRWLRGEDRTPYNSRGNGSAMRVSPVGALARTAEDCLALARWSAEVTHNHPEGVRGAVCMADLIHSAFAGESREDLLRRALTYYPELQHMRVEDLHETYTFSELCQKTVPQALACFFEGRSFEEVLVNSQYIGGDSDTIGAIVGPLAQAFYPGQVQHTDKLLWRINSQDKPGEVLQYTAFLIDEEKYRGVSDLRKARALELRLNRSSSKAGAPRTETE